MNSALDADDRPEDNKLSAVSACYGYAQPWTRPVEAIKSVSLGPHSAKDESALGFAKAPATEKQDCECSSWQRTPDIPTQCRTPLSGM